MDRAITQAAGCLAYLVGVVLFGAWVRITHSGAGCGCTGRRGRRDHPRRHRPRSHRVHPLADQRTVRRLWVDPNGLGQGRFGLRPATVAAAVTLFFIIVEGDRRRLGLAELVADDSSAARHRDLAAPHQHLMSRRSVGCDSLFRRSSTPSAHARARLLLSMVAGFIVVWMTAPSRPREPCSP